MRGIKKSDLLILLFIIGFYLFWEFRSVELPALQTDEARWMCLGFRTIKNLTQDEFAPYSVKIFGRTLPILSVPYHGAGTVYLLIPFILLWGLKVLSVRAFTISFGYITLLLLYLFCKKFFNKTAALIILFLLVIDWTFVIGNKIGIPNFSHLTPFLIGSLLSFYEWYRKRRRCYFYIGCFLVGLGMFAASWVLWYAVALMVIFFIFIKEVKKKFSNREIGITLIIGLLSFCIMLIPLIYYGIKTDFELLRIGVAQFSRTQHSYNNLQYLRNLFVVVGNLRALPFYFFERMSGGFHNGKINKFINKEMINWFYFFLFIICLVWHFSSFKYKNSDFLKQKKMMIVLFFAMFLQTPFVLSSPSPYQLVWLSPIMKILIGLFIFEIMGISKTFKVTILAILFVLFTVHSYGLSQYYSVLEKTGGLETDSDAIYSVAEYLASMKKKSVVLMDARMHHLIYVLSGGEISEKYIDVIDWAGQPNIVDKLTRNENFNKNYYDLIESFGVNSFRVKFFQRLKYEFKDKNNIYLFRSPEFSYVKCFDLFMQLANRENKRVKETKRFLRRDGELMFVAYEIYGADGLDEQIQ